MKAIWNGQVLAESNETVVVEGNHYFPPDSLNKAYFSASEKTSVCPWKGEANYYTLSVDGEVYTDAAWAYAEPHEAAMDIKDHVAFWGDIEITE